MHRTLFLCVVITIMLTLLGCGASAGPQPTESIQPQDTQSTSVASETSEPATVETTDTGTKSDRTSKTSMGDAVIVYERSGGIAGDTETWKVYADGRIVDGDGNEWEVAPAQVEQLLAELKSAGFFELDDAYMPLDTCCDRYTYTLAARRDGNTHRVTTIDDAEAPDALWTAIDAVSAFIQDAQV